MLAWESFHLVQVERLKITGTVTEAEQVNTFLRTSGLPDVQNEAREGVRNNDVASNSDSWHIAFSVSHMTKTWGRGSQAGVKGTMLCVNCERDSI